MDLKDTGKIWFSGRIDKGPVKKAPSPKNGFFLTSDPEYAREYVGNDGSCIVAKLSSKVNPFDFSKDQDIQKLHYPKEVSDIIFKEAFQRDGFYKSYTMTSSGFWATTQSLVEGFEHEVKSLGLSPQEVFKSSSLPQMSTIGKWIASKLKPALASSKLMSNYLKSGHFLDDGREDVYEVQSIILNDMLKCGFNAYYDTGDDGMMWFDELVIFSKDAFKSILPVEITPADLDEVIDTMRDNEDDISNKRLTVRDILVAITGNYDIDASGNDLERRKAEYHSKVQQESKASSLRAMPR